MAVGSRGIAERSSAAAIACGAAARQRGIGQSQLTSDLDPFRLILRACVGTRFGGAAAEIFGIVSYASASLTLLFTRFIARAR